MPRPKKKKEPEIDHAAIESLKEQWFKLAVLERFGKTKYVTRRLDTIEEEIRKLKNPHESSKG